MKEEKYSLELYVSPDFLKNYNLQTNMIYFKDIKGPIPQVGWDIKVPIEIMKTNNKFTENEIYAYSGNFYTVTSIEATLFKGKKGIETKVKVIGKFGNFDFSD